MTSEAWMLDWKTARYVGYNSDFASRLYRVFFLLHFADRFRLRFTPRAVIFSYRKVFVVLFFSFYGRYTNGDGS